MKMSIGIICCGCSFHSNWSEQITSGACVVVVWCAWYLFCGNYTINFCKVENDAQCYETEITTSPLKFSRKLDSLALQPPRSRPRYSTVSQNAACLNMLHRQFKIEFIRYAAKIDPMLIFVARRIWRSRKPQLYRLRNIYDSKMRFNFLHQLQYS